MAKHIHVHIHGGLTKDAFNESNVKRDHGKFSTTGSAGGTAEHHAAKAKEHLAAAASKGQAHPDYGYHKNAATHHRAAAGKLTDAGAHHAKGNEQPKRAAHGSAQAHAETAAANEAEISKRSGGAGASGTPPGKVSLSEAMLSAQKNSAHEAPIKRHPDDAAAKADVKERHAGFEGAGFKHEKSTPSLNGTNHHYAHPDGSRGVVQHEQDPITGRHSVHSYTNTTNKGKK